MGCRRVFALPFLQHPEYTFSAANVQIPQGMLGHAAENLSVSYSAGPLRLCEIASARCRIPSAKHTMPVAKVKPPTAPLGAIRIKIAISVKRTASAMLQKKRKECLF